MTAVALYDAEILGADSWPAPGFGLHVGLADGSFVPVTGES